MRPKQNAWDMMHMTMLQTGPTVRFVEGIHAAALLQKTIKNALEA